MLHTTATAVPISAAPSASNNKKSRWSKQAYAGKICGTNAGWRNDAESRRYTRTATDNIGAGTKGWTRYRLACRIYKIWCLKRGDNNPGEASIARTTREHIISGRISWARIVGAA